MTRKVVLTGFEPFADFNLNPSWEVARILRGTMIDSFEVKAFCIPLAYGRIRDTIEGIIESEQPAVLIALGQSFRTCISMEKVAINFADLSESTTVYNCQTRPIDEVLDPDAPAAYFSRLPIWKILKRLRENDIPAEISYAAGTFGCNQAFFHMMNRIHRDELDICAGFLHVPSLPSQAVQMQKSRNQRIPSMALEMMVEGLRVALKATVEDLGGQKGKRGSD
jgi:pyroglutamyl-peptidase